MNPSSKKVLSEEHTTYESFTDFLKAEINKQSQPKRVSRQLPQNAQLQARSPKLQSLIFDSPRGPLKIMRDFDSSQES